MQALADAGDLLSLTLCEDANLLRFHHLSQQPGAFVVQLPRHQHGRHFHNKHLQPQPFQSICCFQSQQSSPKHNSTTGLLRGVANLLNVVNGAVGQNSWQVCAGDRRNESPAAGGQNQSIVCGCSPGGGGDLFCLAVNANDGVAGVQCNIVGGVPRSGLVLQGVGVVGFQVVGQVDAVIRGSRLFPKNRDLLLRGRLPLHNFANQTKADRPVANNHQRLCWPLDLAAGGSGLADFGFGLLGKDSQRDVPSQQIAGTACR